MHTMLQEITMLPHSTESRVHMWIKEYAAKLLRDMYGCERIEFEYRIDDGRQRYILDVVGFKKTDRYAVECGNTEQTKLVTIRHLFKEMIHISYEDYITALKAEIDLLRQSSQVPNQVYVDSKKIRYGTTDPFTKKVRLWDADGNCIAEIPQGTEHWQLHMRVGKDDEV